MDLAAFTPVLLTRAPAAGRETLAEYEAAGGYRALRRARAGELSPEDLVRTVTEADLRGRGGAGFPTGRKWELARTATVGAPRYVVANGGEHEPGSRTDRVLVTTRPHLVLEGTALAAHATGATRAYLYLIEDMTDALASARAAIDAAGAAGLLGALEVEVATAPTTYVAGEETAALEVIEGRKALPRKKPPYPGESGLFGRPTTVNNLETLAQVPGIIRHGAAWFRALGVEGSTGTMLFTLDASVARPGVYELPFGATFRDLIEGLGGGLTSGRAVKAILPAMSSGFLPASALDLALDHAAVKAAGSGLGCGGISLLAEGDCAVERTVAIAEFFMAEQCGQCPPCRMETNTIAAVLHKVMEGTTGDYRAQIEKIASFTARKGQCSLIEMAAAPVLSALRLFPDDFAHHAAHGRCPPF